MKRTRSLLFGNEILPDAVVPKVLLLDEKNTGLIPENFSGIYHTHIICLRGNAEFRFKQKIFNCRKGEFIFFLKGFKVSDFTVSANFKAVFLLVEDGLLSSNFPDLGTSIEALIFSRENPVMPLESEKDTVKCLDNFRLLHEKYGETDHLYYDEILNGQMRIFLLEMWNLFSRLFEKRKHSLQGGTIFERFMHLVEKHSMKERAVHFYAQNLNITPRYLNKICRENSGFTASQWIQQAVKDRILVLLREGNLSVRQIADEMEFSSYSFFTRYVKKLTGMTPTEYRNRFHN